MSVRFTGKLDRLTIKLNAADEKLLQQKAQDTKNKAQLFTFKGGDGKTTAVHSAGTFANALEQQYPDFGRIRGIANATKHLELREDDVRPVDNAPRRASDTAVHVPGAGLGGYNVGGYGYGTPGLSYAGHPRVMLAGSKDMEFFNIADAARQMWGDLREKHGWW